MRALPPCWQGVRRARHMLAMFGGLNQPRRARCFSATSRQQASQNPRFWAAVNVMSTKSLLFLHLVVLIPLVLLFRRRNVVGHLETGAGTAKTGGMFEARMRPDLQPGVGPGPEWGRPWRSILGNWARTGVGWPALGSGSRQQPLSAKYLVDACQFTPKGP